MNRTECLRASYHGYRHTSIINELIPLAVNLTRWFSIRYAVRMTTTAFPCIMATPNDNLKTKALKRMRKDLRLSCIWTSSWRPLQRQHIFILFRTIEQWGLSPPTKRKILWIYFVGSFENGVSGCVVACRLPQYPDKRWKIYLTANGIVETEMNPI